MLNFLDAIDYLEKNTTQFEPPKAEPKPTPPKAEPTTPKPHQESAPQSPQESTLEGEEGTGGEELL